MLPSLVTYAPPSRVLSMLLPVTLCAWCGCKDKSTRETVERPVTRSVDAGGKDAGHAVVDEPRYSPEESARYRRHLRLGRAHADQGRYGEAVREFDRALDVRPADARALSELGWAAFQAGDWRRAHSANQESVRVAKNPAIRAASLYNLGRLAEALGDRQEAAEHYRASLALRPSDAVDKRLSGLATSKRDKPEGSRSRCPPAPELPRLCQCVSAEDRGARVPAPSSCQGESRDIPGIELLFIGDDAEEWVHLIRRSRRGWSSIARLGRVLDDDGAGGHEEFEVARFERRRIGERNVLWIETVQTRTRAGARVGATGRSGKPRQVVERVRSLVVCPWTADDRDIACPLEVPMSRQRETIRSDGADARPKILTVFALAVDVGDDGRASVILERGKKTSALGSRLGEHQLW